MTNTKWVFEKTIHLMDEADDRSGKIVDSEIADFKHRTLPILNVLRVECGIMSGRRRMPPGLIADFETPIDLDDEVCQGVLPYGLAAHLLLDENPEKASFFQRRYEELLGRYRGTRAAAFEDIELPYGGIGV